MTVTEVTNDFFSVIKYQIMILFLFEYPTYNWVVGDYNSCNHDTLIQSHIVLSSNDLMITYSEFNSSSSDVHWELLWIS